MSLKKNRFSPEDEQSEPITLKIGSNNVFEVYSTIDGVKNIGDNNIFESKSLCDIKYNYIESFFFFTSCVHNISVNV